MVTLTVQVPGQRADQFLAQSLDNLTRSAAQKLLEGGHVLREGKALKKNDRLNLGDELAVLIPDPAPVEILPQDISLDIVYEDGDVIVVNKPVGMVVHPAPGHPDGTLVNALMHHCGASLSGINGELRPGIVHRIDRDTSGLIIAAKNDAAHLALAQQLQDHSLYREYETVVIGGMKEDQGTVDLPIARHPTDRKKMAVNHYNGRRAVTHWRVLNRYRGYTHLQCRLETGRTHQIRVHLAQTGHPVLGDPVYGGVRKGFPELVGQCLHARRLSFVHPSTGERLTLECPLPDYFTATLARCERL
ncbi:MAG: RluA family pseudouridine synthase [Clostridiales bacterium]|uniref:RluA family pseudouridine synthase n=1 Tax=Evtepia sp. TaxID=2773933 RepID=UPI0029848F99|nr:RluA family pseudouridine synthase [Evtepia sp.]MDD7289766.1 RluA family pseudouridine synthase [Clostridiales bacterium]MDY4429410.1 RluA family pseudouridine synthase [Evtepia sp.]